MESSLRREKGGRARVAVCVTRRSTRSLDPDNLVGSVKALLDCLRYAGIIGDDSSEEIELTVLQENVKTRKEAETLIEIEYP